MKSKQLNNASHAPGNHPDNQLALRQQGLITEVLPQFSEGISINNLSTNSTEEDLKHELIKRNMKAKLKRKLGIQS